MRSYWGCSAHCLVNSLESIRERFFRSVPPLFAFTKERRNGAEKAFTDGFQTLTVSALLQSVPAEQKIAVAGEVSTATQQAPSPATKPSSSSSQQMSADKSSSPTRPVSGALKEAPVVNKSKEIPSPDQQVSVPEHVKQSAAPENPKAFWRYVTSRIQTREKVGTLVGEDGKVAESDAEKAEVLNDFFASVFTAEDMTSMPTIGTIPVATRLENVEVTEEKELAHQLCTPLNILFRKSLEAAKLPEGWKQAHVTPIHKKGNRSTPGNYRPVSLTSVVGKVMESIIRDSLVDHMMQNSLFTESQHGFVPGRSCMTQLFVSLPSSSSTRGHKYKLKVPLAKARLRGQVFSIQARRRRLDRLTTGEAFLSRMRYQENLIKASDCGRCTHLAYQYGSQRGVTMNDRQYRRYREWEESDMQEAIRMIKEESKSVYAAAKMSNIPRITLHDRVNERHGDKVGRPPKLSDEDEMALVHYSVYMAGKGFPLTAGVMKALAKEVDKETSKLRGEEPRFGGKTPGKKWKLGEIYEEHRLGERPYAIYNADETGIALDARRSRVIAPTASKWSPAIKSGSRDHITVMSCVSAGGSVLPPMIVYSKALPSGLFSDGGPSGAVNAHSESGYMTRELFEKWFFRTFMPHCHQARPLLLILDQHTSHLSLKVLQTAIKENIIIYGLPPHTSHFTQPLDVTIFSSLKAHWATTIESLQATYTKFQAKKSSFARIFSSVQDETFTPHNIKTGFLTKKETVQCKPCRVILPDILKERPELRTMSTEARTAMEESDKFAQDSTAKKSSSTATGVNEATEEKPKQETSPKGGVSSKQEISSKQAISSKVEISSKQEVAQEQEIPSQTNDLSTLAEETPSSVDDAAMSTELTVPSIPPASATSNQQESDSAEQDMTASSNPESVPVNQSVSASDQASVPKQVVASTSPVPVSPPTPAKDCSVQQAMPSVSQASVKPAEATTSESSVPFQPVFAAGSHVSPPVVAPASQVETADQAVATVNQISAPEITSPLQALALLAQKVASSGQASGPVRNAPQAVQEAATPAKALTVSALLQSVPAEQKIAVAGEMSADKSSSPSTSVDNLPPPLLQPEVTSSSPLLIPAPRPATVDSDVVIVEAFWRYVTSRIQTREKVGTLVGEDGKVAESDAEKAEVLNDFFASVFTAEDMTSMPTIGTIPVATRLENVEVTEEKELAHQLCTPLNILFRKSLEAAKLPEGWKQAHVTPIHKKGNRSTPGNYRPVSLTSVVGKVMESIIRDSLVDHMMQNSLFTESQHGFVPGRSCMTQLFVSLPSSSSTRGHKYKLKVPLAKARLRGQVFSIQARRRRLDRLTTGEAFLSRMRYQENLIKASDCGRCTHLAYQYGSQRGVTMNDRQYRRYREWEESDMQEAIRMIKEESKSVYAAAKMSNIPRITLHDRVNERHGDKVGRPPKLSDEDEMALVHYSVYMAGKGFPLTAGVMKALAKEVDKETSKLRGEEPRFGGKTPGKKWKLGEIYEEHRLGERPYAIYNADETGIALDARRSRVIAPTASKWSPAIKSGSRDHITVMSCVSAGGSVLPPMIVYSKALPSGLFSDGGPSGAVNAHSESGYMTRELFEKCFFRTFMPHCHQARPLLLILDQHTSHLSLKVLQTAIKENIIIYGLPPHTSHFTQPLDVTIFSSLKAHWATTIESLQATNTKFQAKKSSFARIFSSVQDETFTPHNIKTGFRK
ncbi:hypothetical protein Bbelb_111680 [Branchiostoma belcheri]|nr:hypothetical protein Bbelb_111680 [Branchiostoma belcheri]